jgi:hypothetical protein
LSKVLLSVEPNTAPFANSGAICGPGLHYRGCLPYFGERGFTILVKRLKPWSVNCLWRFSVTPAAARMTRQGLA